MPAINPNNYNIDFFQSYSFGDITDTNYLTYLFGQNLPNLPQELIDGAAGNFLSQYNQRGLEKDINYGPITNPGNLDEWLLEGNFPVELNDIRNVKILGENEYGPQTIEAYNCPDLEGEETGFIQYPTSTGGNVVTSLLGETLDAVGLGGLNAFLIDFPSELNEVANERRLSELKSRVRENIINETVGRINLDPLGLLAGQPLFGKDYKITKPAKGIPIPGLGALTDLADINLLALRRDPLPDGSFDWGQKPMDDPFSENQIDISQTLLQHTGKGTKTLLFESLAPNKYGPIIEGQNEPLGDEPKKAKDANQPTQKGGYLDYTYETPVGSKAKSVKENKTKLASVVDKIKNIGKSESKDLAPTEENNPTVVDSPIMAFKNKGFDFDGVYEMDFTTLKGSWDFQHLASWTNQYYPSQITTDNTTYEDVGSTLDNIGPEPNSRWNGDLFWKDGRAESILPKKGLLRYTQKLINKSTGEKGRGSAAQFIGLPNSDQNYNMDSNDRRHIEMSQGSLVKETKENKYYCRSWSVRNTYNRYNDLIRHDELWRNTQPGTIKEGKSDTNTKLGQFSTLRSPGIPKIAWEKDGEIEKKIMALKGLTVDENLVIPYMFSIENLAWKDSPHFRKLPQCEKGPFGGRLMWFPPYNISFTDNTSVNWDTTSFIGRAEPIYTYNNTERTGTLTFSIVVDHPSIINKIKDDAFKTTTINDNGEVVEVSSSTNLETFFAGCDADTTKNIVREAFKEIIPSEEEKIPEPEEIKFNEINIVIPVVNDGLSFYFKNALSSFSTDQTGNYPHYPEISSNSSCPGGSLSNNTNDIEKYNVQGRCIDWNYEKNGMVWYDNPKLYKTGSLTSGGRCWGCELCDEPNNLASGADSVLSESDKDTIVPAGFNQEELVEIPIGTLDSRGNPIEGLPCGGEKTNVKWGPDPTKSFENLWWDFSSGKGYDMNFCKECLPTTGATNQTITCPAGYTLSGTSICYSGTTTASSITTPAEIINSDILGFEGGRNGYNQRFWGTGDAVNPVPSSVTYPSSNKSPKLNLGVDKEWKFAVTEFGGGVAGMGISQLIEFLTTTPEGKGYTIKFVGNASAFGSGDYNKTLSKDRSESIRAWMYKQMLLCEAAHAGNGVEYQQQGMEDIITLYKEGEYGPKQGDWSQNQRWAFDYKGESQASGIGNNSDNDKPNSQSSSVAGEFTRTPSALHPADTENKCQLESRRVDISIIHNPELFKKAEDDINKKNEENIQGINEALAAEFKAKKALELAEAESEKTKAMNLAKNFINECDYFMKIKEEDSFLYDSLKDKLRNFHPAFHSITPEGFNSRITFLQQCGRQGPSLIDPNQPQNTAFGRPPVCILRIGDFYNTKIVIDTINLTFDPLQWDLNPEGIGVQPMLCSVDLNFKFIGGSTLQGPLSALQNAVSYNFFANTALYMPLDKILTTRTDAGKILEGSTYFYGPFAGQAEFNEAIGLNKESEDVDTDEDNESEEAASLGKGGNDGGESPIPGCPNAVLLSEQDKVVALTSGIDGDTAEAADSYTYVKANPDDFDGWYCDDDTNIFWVRKVPDINKTEEEILEEAKDGNENGGGTDGTEIGAPNTTTDEGGLLFAETSSLIYDQGETYSNDYGKITIGGDYVDAENGIGSYLSPITDPTNGLLPNYVCGRISPDIANDYDVTITQDNGYKSLDGGSGTRGGGNNAVVWDNVNPPAKETENSCCTVTDADRPSEQVGRQIFAFNILDYAINLESFEQWAFEAAGGGDGDDFYSSDLIETIQKNIDDKGVAKWNVNFYIKMRETAESLDTRIVNGATGDDAFRKVHSGSIRIVGEINQLGLNAIKVAVGAQ